MTKYLFFACVFFVLACTGIHEEDSQNARQYIAIIEKRSRPVLSANYTSTENDTIIISAANDESAYYEAYKTYTANLNAVLKAADTIYNKFKNLTKVRKFALGAGIPVDFKLQDNSGQPVVIRQTQQDSIKEQLNTLAMFDSTDRVFKEIEKLKYKYKTTTKSPSKTIITQALVSKTLSNKSANKTSSKTSIAKTYKAQTKYRKSNSSGYCGAPTKKGGVCRRRVIGGGYCWQHGG